MRTAYLDTTRGYFNGGAVFLCPEGRENAPCTLRDRAAGRPGVRQMALRDDADARPTPAKWRFRAANYDELIDHPVEMADFAVWRASRPAACRTEVAITGRHTIDVRTRWSAISRASANGRSISSAARRPSRAYLFQVMAVGDGHGGLEHRSSTSLLCSRNSLPQPGMTEHDRRLRQLPRPREPRVLPRVEREADQAGGVRAVRPRRARTTRASSGRSRASRPTTTTWRWCAAASSAEAKYLELLGRGDHHGAAHAGPARAERRRRELRRVDQVLPAGRELAERASSATTRRARWWRWRSTCTLRLDGRTTLDDVMRALWQRYGETGIGVPEDGIGALASELAGRDLGDFFARYVHGTEDPPLASLLAAHGVTLELRAATGDNDRGGKPATADGAARSWLGAKVGADLELQHVYSGGPAERAGLAAGDTLVAFDGVKASRRRARRRCSSAAAAGSARRRSRTFAATS